MSPCRRPDLSRRDSLDNVYMYTCDDALFAGLGDAQV
jgi:hypothetical protein